MNRRHFLTLIGTSTASYAAQQKLHYLDFDKELVKSIQNEKESLIHYKEILKKLVQAKRQVGFTDFNIISFEELLKEVYLTHKEKTVFEELFYTDATTFGFHDMRISALLNEKISKREVVKIPRTGHYLYRGKPHTTYNKIQKDLHGSIVLTSGVRSNVKQTYLFLNKLLACGGDFNETSKSVAPPGHSFHLAGDFDIGKQGFGMKNFSTALIKTDAYQELLELNYIKLRYGQKSSSSVKYEPWHLKIV